MLRTAAVLLTCIAPVTNAQAPDGGAADTTGARIDAWALQQMSRGMIPGLALVVVESGRIVKVGGYGSANLEHGVPVTPATVFQTGSVGKQFTAAAVVALAEAGRLGLDDAVSAHIGFEAPAWKDVTIRQLLTHTSGIGDYLDGVDYERDYEDDELLAIFGALEPQFAPGERWRYSNTGYALLGLMISAKLGRSYLEFLDERFFEPLGMDTARGISDAAIVPNRSSGYRFVRGELQHHDYVPPSLNRTGDGCLYLTVLDFAKWDAALYSERALTDESKRQMWTPVELNDGSTHPYGFGWGIDEVRGHRVLSHSGGWQGFSTHISRFVDAELTVVVLCNRAYAEAEHIARGALGVIDPELGPWTPEPGELDRERAAKLVGDYALGGSVRRVRLEDEGLFLYVDDERLSLAGGQRGRYHTPDGASVRFRRDSDGRGERLDAFGLRAYPVEPDDRDE